MAPKLEGHLMINAGLLYKWRKTIFLLYPLSVCKLAFCFFSSSNFIFFYLFILLIYKLPVWVSMTSCIVFPNCGCPSSSDYPDYFHLVLNNLPLTCEVCMFLIFFASLLQFVCMNARPTLSALDLFAFFYFWTILFWEANVPETCKFGHCIHLTSATQHLPIVYVPGFKGPVCTIWRDLLVWHGIKNA